MLDITWWLRSMILATTASLEFAIEDPRQFAGKLLERLRASKLRHWAEHIQSRMVKTTVEVSQIKQEYARKNFTKLSSLRLNNSLQNFSRSDRRLIRRATELNELLTRQTMRVSELTNNAKGPTPG